MSKKVEEAAVEAAAAVAEAAPQEAAVEAENAAKLDPDADDAGGLVEVVLTCFYGDHGPGDTIPVDAIEAERLIGIGAAKSIVGAEG